MSPRTNQQFNKMRQARKVQIMNSALELFATKGFKGTSIADIAANTGISKGLLYNYFSSKEELIKDIIFKGFNALLDSFDPNHDGVLTRSEMKFLTIGLLNTIKTDIPFWKLYFAMFTQPVIYKLVEEKLLTASAPIFKMLAEYFKSSGSTAPNIDARMFSAMLDGIALNFVYDPSNFPLKEVIEKFIEMFNLSDESYEN
jgi:AcrR family transcriptional regulator